MYSKTLVLAHELYLGYPNDVSVYLWKHLNKKIDTTLSTF